MSKFVTWKAAPAPTGRYRSFHKRGWPSAEFKNADKDPAARIACADAYTPTQARTGDHAELQIYIADWAPSREEQRKHGAFIWRRLKKRCATLDEAKKLVDEFFTDQPQFIRK